MPFAQHVRPYYARQAETLLNTWICGDAATLRTELDRAVNCHWPGAGIDRYLVELLRLVATGMRTCPDLYVPTAANPAVGIYLDILQRLSADQPR